MPSFVRSVMAILAGCLAAFFHIAAIETLGHLVYPLPPDLDLSSREAMLAHWKSVPPGALLIILVGNAVGTFAGSWFAARLAPGPRRNHGWAVGALFLIATAANLSMIRYPVWFRAASLTAIPAASYLGAALGASGVIRMPVATDRGRLET